MKNQLTYQLKCSARYLLVGTLALCPVPLQDLAAQEQSPEPLPISSLSEGGANARAEGLEDAELSNLSVDSFTQTLENETARESDTRTELIHERFPNGRIRLERTVVLDPQGNYVNHGDYKEMNVAGEVICSGRYSMGARQGTWTRECQAKDSKLFEAYPFNKLTPPFRSTVDFVDGKMDGVWLIVDSKGLEASRITLKDGFRNGLASIFHPSREILFQAEYRSGILNGKYIERDASGKIIRQEVYADGQKSVNEIETFAGVTANGQKSNKQTKSEYQYLSAVQAVSELDKWDTTMFATSENRGERVKHGPFILNFENGQMKVRGTYEHGLLTGAFESWYINGQRESTGEYVRGVQDGRWSWWHSNGMRSAIAEYNNGQLSDSPIAWTADGRRKVPAEQTKQFSNNRDGNVQIPVSKGNSR